MKTKEQVAQRLKEMAQEIHLYKGDHSGLEATFKHLEKKAKTMLRGPVQIKVVGSQLQVIGLKNADGNFWVFKAGMEKIGGIKTGLFHNKPGKSYDKEPIFAKNYDKDLDANVMPADREAAVIAFLDEHKVEWKKTG